MFSLFLLSDPRQQIGQRFLGVVVNSYTWHGKIMSSFQLLNTPWAIVEKSWSQIIIIQHIQHILCSGNLCWNKLQVVSENMRVYWYHSRVWPLSPGVSSKHWCMFVLHLWFQHYVFKCIIIQQIDYEKGKNPVMILNDTDFMSHLEHLTIKSIFFLSLSVGLP